MCGVRLTEADETEIKGSKVKDFSFGLLTINSQGESTVVPFIKNQLV